MTIATAPAPARRANTPSKARLWAGVAIAPAAWSVAELAGYIGAGRGCWGTWPNGRSIGPANSTAWVLVVGGITLIVAAVGLGIAAGNFRRTSPEPPQGTRAHFMAAVGLGASTLFLCGIVLFLIPPLIIHACTATR